MGAVAWGDVVKGEQYFYRVNNVELLVTVEELEYETLRNFEFTNSVLVILRASINEVFKDGGLKFNVGDMMQLSGRMEDKPRFFTLSGIDFLANTLSQTRIEPWKIYRHNASGNLYLVHGIGKETKEAKPVVIYTALYGDCTTWVRDLEEFADMVVLEDEPTPRFEKVTIERKVGVGKVEKTD